ncbi:MAG: hypothetical protein U1F43_05345 [Myxococcota bacterium]
MAKQLPSVPDGRALRDEATRLTQVVVDRLRDITGAFWEIGNVLERIQSQKLYAALGYDSFRSYVDGALGVATTQAYMMIRVVRAYTRSDAESLGLERAAGLITYAKALGGTVDPGLLVRENAPVGDKPARVASLRDIQAAVRAQREARSAKRRRSPRERLRKREADAIAAGLRAAHRAQDLGRGVVEVRDDEVVVRFSREALARRFAR